MHERSRETHDLQSPSWPLLTVWAIVNSVNMLQSAGFVSRVITHDREINQLLGLAILALAVPAAVCLVALVRARARLFWVAGPVVFIAFCVVSLAVDHVWLREFRDPANPRILVPYLVLFFGSIVLMGAPMFSIDKRLWLVTVATSILLVVTMVTAMAAGVG